MACAYFGELVITLVRKPILSAATVVELVEMLTRSCESTVLHFSYIVPRNFLLEIP